MADWCRRVRGHSVPVTQHMLALNIELASVMQAWPNGVRGQGAIRPRRTFVAENAVLMTRDSMAFEPIESPQETDFLAR